MAEEVLSGTNNFTSWKRRMDTQVNSIRSEGVSGGVPTDEEQRTVQNAIKDIQVISDCIAKKSKCVAGLGTTIAGSQETILSLKEQIQTEKDGLQITKERLSYVRAPDQSTSFYQSWFPLDRPLKMISVPILLGFVFFFMVVSLGVLLMLFGVNLAIYIPGIGQTGTSLDQYNQDRSWRDYLKGKAVSTFSNATIQDRYKQIQREAERKRWEERQARKQTDRSPWSFY
jgi:hypothetical protein